MGKLISQTLDNCLQRVNVVYDNSSELIDISLNVHQAL